MGKQYLVSWVIDIELDEDEHEPDIHPEDAAKLAAEKAWNYMTAPGSTANVFEVTEEKETGGQTYKVDLMENTVEVITEKK